MDICLLCLGTLVQETVVTIMQMIIAFMLLNHHIYVSAAKQTNSRNPENLFSLSVVT
jgi:hypothetical protein